ncbi:hypothetical protein EDD17DRAFT_1506017 [Pisolithus thermaeus]|nr:hypothetical protein EDD17DRAFT_1506017 [Pisolithus thermaeus]
MDQGSIVPLCDQVSENPGASQAPIAHQRSPTRGQPFHPRGGGHPSGRKARGGIPELPQEAPPLDTPVQDWVKFIQTYQNRYSGLDESSKLSKMFPGALGITEHPNDNEWEIGPPSAQMVQGFLLYERLAPVPRRDHDQMVWFQELVCLLTARGFYRALLKWAEVSPHTGPQVPWALMALHPTMPMMPLSGHVGNGGDQDPNVQAVVDLLRASIHNPQPPSKNWSVKWVNQQAQVLGISPERIMAYEAHTIETGEVYILQEFAIGDEQGMGGAPPAGTGETEEGEMSDWPAPM